METEGHKYEIVIQFIKEQVLTGLLAFGDKTLSENELAEKFGLSRFTVRHALSILVNEGILEKRHGSGTFVKYKATSRDPSNTIGVVTTYLDDYVFPGIVNGIDEILSKQGYTLSLGITRNKTEKERECLKSLLQNNIDGLIIEGTKSAFPSVNTDILKEFKYKNIPIIFINGKYNEIDASYVLMDDVSGGNLAAEYLIEKGHTKIGGIFKSDDMQGHNRYKGYVEACHRYGLTIDENAVLWYTTEDIDSVFHPDYDKLFMRRFRDVTALICYNDQIAVKAMDTVKRNGKTIPEDISFISFDNSSLADLASVGLTSFVYDSKRIGMEAACAFLESVRSVKPVHKILDFSMVERNSVKILK